MPEIDGIELVDQLRSRNVSLPAIPISGRVSKGLRSLAQRSGLTRVPRPQLPEETTMSKGVKDTFGYLGTDPMALREQLEQLSAALQELAKAEGAEAIKAAKRCRAPRRRPRRRDRRRARGQGRRGHGRDGQGPRPGRRRHSRTASDGGVAGGGGRLPAGPAGAAMSPPSQDGSSLLTALVKSLAAIGALSVGAARAACGLDCRRLCSSSPSCSPSACASSPLPAIARSSWRWAASRPR